MSRFLVVDDNATNLALFRHLLQKLDAADIQCFADPKMALEWCVDNEPDLILLDYRMPDINGLEFLRRLRLIPGRADVSVVMVTADTENDIRYQALQLGAQDFLTKPVDKTELTARVRNLTALRQSQKKLADRAAWLAEEVRLATAEIAAREKEAILRLSRAAEYRDPETGAHLLRMSSYARIIAAQLGLSTAEQNLLHEASPMHDIGKVGIPDHILLKPGKLTPEEFAAMKQHASIGHEILRDSASTLLQCAAVVAMSHHEKFDGSGYPSGLKGTEIPLWGRIVAVADVFDALTSERPYKKAWSIDEARRFLEQGAGSHFDPDCVAGFLAQWSQVLEIHTRYKDHLPHHPE
ncbi:HD domain-containing phosphohydrolase [Rhodoferax sp.]|uniref:HD domain-containing phosphohydrolase n=1 Tax=Rhodoferax sp. TaxID=50421 RepID=UPI002617B99A|nr:HD domain-containing phosphohydrolase [Rhodoferax sp.]MDD2925121.1 response regulator [Rhodoferax sp.]